MVPFRTNCYHEGAKLNLPCPQIKESIIKALSCSIIAVMSIFLFISMTSAVDVFPVKYEKVSFSWKTYTIFEGAIRMYLWNNNCEDIFDVAATISSSLTNLESHVSFLS